MGSGKGLILDGLYIAPIGSTCRVSRFGKRNQEEGGKPMRRGRKPAENPPRERLKRGRKHKILDGWRSLSHNEKACVAKLHLVIAIASE